MDVKTGKARYRQKQGDKHVTQRVRECPKSLKAAIDLANTRRTRKAWVMSPAEARAKLKRIIEEVAKHRELAKEMEETRARVEHAASLPAPIWPKETEISATLKSLNIDATEAAAAYKKWEEERARAFKPLLHRFVMKTEALLQTDEDGVLRAGFDIIDRAIIGETYDELDRIRECANPKCRRIFWAGKATYQGKRIEGCRPACQNIIRLQRRDRSASEQEIQTVSTTLKHMAGAMNRLGEAWEFEASAETVAEVAERADLPKSRVKRTLQNPEVQNLIRGLTRTPNTSGKALHRQPSTERQTDAGTVYRNSQGTKSRTPTT